MSEPVKIERKKGEHSAILLTFIKLPFVFKTFVLSIFEWPLKTGFTVCDKLFYQMGWHTEIKLASKRKNLSSWFLTKQDSNQSAQL